MPYELFAVLAAADENEKHHLHEDYDNRMMRVIRQYNYDNRTNFDAHITFLDYLLSDYCQA